MNASELDQAAQFEELLVLVRDAKVTSYAISELHSVWRAVEVEVLNPFSLYSGLFGHSFVSLTRCGLNM